MLCRIQRGYAVHRRVCLGRQPRLRHKPVTRRAMRTRQYTVWMLTVFGIAIGCQHDLTLDVGAGSSVDRFESIRRRLAITIEPGAGNQAGWGDCSVTECSPNSFRLLVRQWICPRYGRPRSGGSDGSVRGTAGRGAAGAAPAARSEDRGSPPGAGRPLQRSSRSRSSGLVRRRRTRMLSSASDGRTDARPGLVPSRASATCARLRRAMAGRGRDGCAG